MSENDNSLFGDHRTVLWPRNGDLLLGTKWITTNPQLDCCGTASNTIFIYKIGILAEGQQSLAKEFLHFPGYSAWKQHQSLIFLCWWCVLTCQRTCFQQILTLHCEVRNFVMENRTTERKCWELLLARPTRQSSFQVFNLSFKEGSQEENPEIPWGSQSQSSF